MGQLPSWPRRCAVVPECIPDESEQPGMLIEQPDRSFRFLFGHPGQVGPQVREYTDHPGHDGLGIGPLREAVILTVNEAASDQLVSHDW